MTTISMHRATVTVFARALRNLITIMQKGEASAAARKIDPSVLLNYRIAPDMFPLARQVQIATDMAKGCVSRLAGVDVPAWEDKEASFGELIARLEKCIAYIEGFTPAQIDGTEDKIITLKRPTGEVTHPGLQYALEFVTPNVFFHCTAAYMILRHCGVDVGKKDFIGGM